MNKPSCFDCQHAITVDAGPNQPFPVHRCTVNDLPYLVEDHKPTYRELKTFSDHAINCPKYTHWSE